MNWKTWNLKRRKVSNFPELKKDAAEFYEWAERVAPNEPYGIDYHLHEVRRALDNLNELITKTFYNEQQNNRRSK